MDTLAKGEVLKNNVKHGNSQTCMAVAAVLCGKNGPTGQAYFKLHLATCF